MLTTYQRHAKTRLIATIFSVLIIAGVVVVADHLKAKGAASTNMATQTTVTTAPTTASTGTATPAASSPPGTSSYTDGTFTASTSYYVPHGNENIRVSLTLQSGVVTSASITNSEGDPDSASYQEDFASAYKSYVVGKKISGLKLNVIAGASDTTQGFNDALSRIATKAQA